MRRTGGLDLHGSRKVSLPNLKHYLDTCLDGLIKTTRNPTTDFGCYTGLFECSKTSTHKYTARCGLLPVTP
jgi:hypothetical protein